MTRDKVQAEHDKALREKTAVAHEYTQTMGEIREKVQNLEKQHSDLVQ